MQKLTITHPDDWHLHLRDGILLQTTVPHSARQSRRAIIMPNLQRPITDVIQAEAYRKRILAHIPTKLSFEPLMTLYLTEALTREMIQAAKSSELIYACKLYPLGATTHSELGVSKIKQIYPILEEMEKQQLPLLIHGEVIHPDVDIFDREKYFIEEELMPIIRDFPNLKIVLEHITTQEAAEFITAAPTQVAATITSHHLLLNRNALFTGGINPHHYCLPVLKRQLHQQALIKAATSGNKKFFLGTDSAPHAIQKKECHHGCAGIYTAHAAIELYAEAFENAGALDKLESFASFNGADFYGLPRNKESITLVKQPWRVPEKIKFGESELLPFRAGEMIQWRLEE